MNVEFIVVISCSLLHCLGGGVSSDGESYSMDPLLRDHEEGSLDPLLESNMELLLKAAGLEVSREGEEREGDGGKGRKGEGKWKEGGGCRREGGWEKGWY
jgi:hypothetical protein